MIDTDDLIFLVDDDADEISFFTFAIQKIGKPDAFRAMTNGGDLIDYLSKPGNKLPAIIFLDINMPGMSGLDVLKLVRQKYNQFLLPVAIYATAVDQKEVKTAAALGANLFIRKPGDIKALSSIIENALSRNWELLMKSAYSIPMEK